jgi:hypothetical protein
LSGNIGIYRKTGGPHGGFPGKSCSMDVWLIQLEFLKVQTSSLGSPGQNKIYGKIKNKAT